MVMNNTFYYLAVKYADKLISLGDNRYSISRELLDEYLILLKKITKNNAEKLLPPINSVIDDQYFLYIEETKKIIEDMLNSGDNTFGYVGSVK